MSTATSRWTRAIDHEYSAAIALGGGVSVALLWSGLFSASYQRTVNGTWSVHLLKFAQIDSPHGLVVGAMMTLFFFAIGLELARELSSGLLTKPAHSLPPLLGALGGMMATALLSVLSGDLLHSRALRHGWGIPMATDIAFALGALALCGRRLPPTLRIFLLALAIADDVFSVIVLAFTGTTHVRAVGVAAIVVAVGIVVVVSRRTTSTTWRLAVLVALWCCFVYARVEPPLAGVLAAVVVPFRAPGALRLEERTRRLSVALVLPLFAVVSIGVRWSTLAGHSVTTVIVATVLIRTVGKVIGVVGGVALAKTFGFRLHHSISWRLLGASSLLCAIGFTVPLLFAGALYSTASSTYGAFAVGLLVGSLVSGLLGVTLLRRLTRQR